MYSTSTSAQNIGADSEGKGVFTYNALKSYWVDFASDEPLGFTLTKPRWRARYFYLNPLKDSITTMYKLRGVVANIALLNSGEDPVLTEVFKTPGLQFKLGYQSAIDTIYNLRVTNGCITMGATGVFSFDNFKFYDVATAKVSKKYPLTFGAEMNWTYFIKDDPSKKLFRNIWALNLTFRRTWNDDDLLQFQEIGTGLGIATPTVIAAKDFKGRYGTLERINQVRLSASHPFFWRRVNLIPYVMVKSDLDDNHQVTPGAMFNVMAEALKPNTYTFPSMFGIGVDWAGRDWNKPNAFVRGAFSVGRYKQAPAPLAPKQVY